jgi:hypothetical protein
MAKTKNKLYRTTEGVRGRMKRRLTIGGDGLTKYGLTIGLFLTKKHGDFVRDLRGLYCFAITIPESNEGSTDYRRYLTDTYVTLPARTVLFHNHRSHKMRRAESTALPTTVAPGTAWPTTIAPALPHPAPASVTMSAPVTASPTPLQ